ncbi:helix-turn-helix domain-containing protein [Novosphingobium sp. BL-8H]|uniref:helix-turn-helix domain-containing protein n=1 Tax=Novosphingobium sp. BL-8H TaxID=3127640 RepID=UPI003756954A
MTALLTEKEAADMLRIAPRTLRELRAKGAIQYVALTARKIAYRPEDCAAYVATRLRTERPATDPNAKGRRRIVKGPTAGGQIIPFSQLSRP